MNLMTQKLSNYFLTLIIICFGFSLTMEKSYAADDNIKFAIISDHKGDYVGLQNVLIFIAEQQVDFILVPGDYEPLKKAYQDYYTKMGFVVSRDNEPDMQDVYYMIGNHDNPSSGSDFYQGMIAPYYPANGPNDAPRGTIYSFDRGNAHFVATNQYWNYGSGGYTDEQLRWIEGDLQSSQQPFKFVFGHEPAFPLDRHVGDSLDADPEMRDEFWKMLADNGVQAFFCGHTHHLSIVKDQGVYQIDTGEVAASHITVVIVEINDAGAIARLYETEGEIPEAVDNPFNTSLENGDTGDQQYEVVFDSGITHPESSSSNGCIIQTLTHSLITKRTH